MKLIINKYPKTKYWIFPWYDNKEIPVPKKGSIWRQKYKIFIVKNVISYEKDILISFSSIFSRKRQIENLKSFYNFINFG